MYPRTLYIPVYQPFEIECTSSRPFNTPIAMFANGALVESDSRFEIIRPTSQKLIVRAKEGLTNVYNGIRIR